MKNIAADFARSATHKSKHKNLAEHEKSQKQFADSVTGVSPRVNDMHPDDQALLHEWLDAHYANPTASVIGELGEGAERLLGHYFGNEWVGSEPKTMRKLFEAALDRNASVMPDDRAQFPLQP